MYSADHAHKCCYDTFSDCCKNCSKCPNCYSITISKLSDLLYSVKTSISDYTKSYIDKAFYGYSQCSSLSKDSYKKLLEYKQSLERLYISVLNGYDPCLCPEDIQSIYENTLELVDISCCKSDRCDIIIDRSGYDDWVLRNPYCICYEDWEAAFIKKCPRVTIDVSEVENPSLLTYTLSVIDQTPYVCNIEVFDTITDTTCEISVIDEVTLQHCEITIDSVVKTRECKLEYNALVKNLKCDFSFSTYVKLLSCNLTYNVISKLLECGINVDYNVTRRCCDLILSPTSTVSMCDVDLNDIIQI